MCKSLLKIYTKERQKRFYNFIAKLLIGYLEHTCLFRETF